jgi:hypothetical protein
MLAALSLAACSQGRNDPCQVDRDCASGLLCCAGDTPRGTCELTCPDAVSDAGASDGEDAGEP